jgi:FSR family fosmidomycin resistance protein-like MFS transporter
VRPTDLRVHRTVTVLAATHFIVDGFSNIYSPLLPLLIPRLGLTLATAGLLQTCLQLSSSISQLGFGALADRWNPRVLLIAGPLLSVAVLSLIGLAHDALTVGAILIIGGLGAAAFHPPAAALVHKVGGTRRGWAMSVHITAGSLGFALGPLVFAPFVAWAGLAWTPVLMVPGLLLLATWLHRIPASDTPHLTREIGSFAALRPYARPLTLLYLIVVIRTLTAISFSTFIPVLLTRRGVSVGAAGAMTAVYLAASSAGGFFGGAMADRWGARRVIIASLVAAVPFLAVAPLLPNAMLLLVLSIGGCLLQSTLPVNVTFGQTIAPVSAATVASLMMGFAWGTGGLFVALVGILADRSSIEQALMLMAVLPLGAALLALPLPDNGAVTTVTVHEP